MNRAAWMWDRLFRMHWPERYWRNLGVIALGVMLVAVVFHPQDYDLAALGVVLLNVALMAYSSIRANRIHQANFKSCPVCHGSGEVRSELSLAEMLRPLSPEGDAKAE